MNFIKIFFILKLCLLLTFLCNAQQKVKLTNTKSGKEIVLKESHQVVYLLKNSQFAAKGIFKRVTADSLTVGDKTVALQDIKSLGRRKKGAVFGMILMGAVGGALLGAAIAPDGAPECTNCQITVEDKGGTEGDIILAVAGASLVALAVNSGIKNSAKPVSDGKWTLTIIE